MKCPVDNETLVIAERGGVEIDYCPKCRGVWLDRGELDKIIERSAPSAPSQSPVSDRRPQEYRNEPREYRDDDRKRYSDDDHDYRGKPKRRESFLSDLFDF